MLWETLWGMGKAGFGLLPVSIGVLFFAETALVYVVSVLNGEIDEALPFITTSADNRPQSCIFSMFTNIISFFLMVVVYVRYKQVIGTLSTFDGKVHFIVWNQISRWLGWFSGIGWFIVANVQETACVTVHKVGIYMAFGGFTVYMIIQSYISYFVYQGYIKKSIYYTRLYMTWLTVIFFISTVTCEIIAINQFQAVFPLVPTPPPWNRTQPGFKMHQISATSQWFCVLCQMIFIITLAPELEKVTYFYFLSCEFVVPQNANFQNARNSFLARRRRYML
ncbi:hypothetical protein L5515_019105 [Caenorhabditis briggsae]|uniref:CWH43-like N-terminal domain-containing protein n=2 Tax=Caenorhabditis briggsae TaxID=6238 RepID=A0AAE9FDX4_CAEBR|nr:hypothetical protein L5515_019105 [Caenorhabditis briggsae]